ncbi:N-acetyltransferase [uncultured Salegentibacter sp.]|uniref:N-acetyltransferase n=1 Tax=uncultured Salegentibacter sp. TaxID=259320 RepID=UPI00259712AC|nr:N-acetyltransferase [uncultured Salegentibacter sp.]
MKIRKLNTKDIETVVELWYETSIIAHDFIQADYWEKNKEAMASIYLPNSETYLAIEDEKIAGFVAMAENFLAAIFVNNQIQGKGIGRKLLNFVKDTRTMIQLKVYKKNMKTVDFYRSQGFEVISENKEEKTGEYEFLMEWREE